MGQGCDRRSLSHQAEPCVSLEAGVSGTMFIRGSSVGRLGVIQSGADKTCANVLFLVWWRALLVSVAESVRSVCGHSGGFLGVWPELVRVMTLGRRGLGDERCAVAERGSVSYARYVTAAAVLASVAVGVLFEKSEAA